MLFIPALICGATPALAMNWEGHDDWLGDTKPFVEYMEGVPPPLLAPLPSCAARAAKHAANPYEQAAIPGKNCMPALAPTDG